MKHKIENLLYRRRVFCNTL